MTCSNCQKEIVEGSRYCYHCGAAQGPLTPPPVERPPLRRSRKHKAIAGVCGGFAEHFDLDISLMRVIWLLVAILGCGAGLIAYLICWVVIPLQEVESVTPAPAPR